MQLEPSSNIYSRTHPIQYNINRNHETQYMNTRQFGYSTLSMKNQYTQKRQANISVGQLVIQMTCEGYKGCK